MRGAHKFAQQEVGLQMGYNFRVLGFHLKDADDNSTAHVMITNTGVAPAYHDMFLAVNGKRARNSLKYLQPGQTKSFYIGGLDNTKYACTHMFVYVS